MPDSPPAAPVFGCDELGFTYAGGTRPALVDIDLRITAGTRVMLVGPNGAGKSSLLALLSGALQPSHGVVRFLGKPLRTWPRRELARELAVVEQEAPPALPLTVREFVEMGRNPYVSPWAALDERDRERVRDAIVRCDLSRLDGRPISQLSGGELQRAKLARALAQEPSVLLLDEPTAHLDIGHAISFHELLETFRARHGLTVIHATHDLHLASRYSDHLVLLREGRTVAAGAPSTVLTPSALEAAYDCRVHVRPMGEFGLVVLAAPAARSAG